VKRYLLVYTDTNTTVSIQKVKEVEVPKRTILVTDSRTVEKTELPAGVRIGYSTDENEAHSFFADELITGYAFSNSEVIFYEVGEEASRKQFKENDHSMLIRMESEECLDALECEFLNVYKQGYTDSLLSHLTRRIPNISRKGRRLVDVEFDVQGWEIVEENK
jgi:hypothetical protein